MDRPSTGPMQEQNSDFTSDEPLEPPQSNDAYGPPPLMSKDRRVTAHDLFANYRRSNAFGNYMGGYRSTHPMRNSFGPGPMYYMDGPGAGDWYRGSGGPMRRGPGPIGFGGPPGMDDMVYEDEYNEMIQIRRMGPPMRNSAPSFNESPYCYLQRCGMRDDEMVKLPREYFCLIEPDRCNVCNLHLVSFAQSRAHYVSRQHWRNSALWLDQWSEKARRVAPRVAARNRAEKQLLEQPLKARELFCELCHLQLTSKVHADSHYAGKSHRAVVEGRKEPKNKKLLSVSQKYRYDALIKREKRAIRALMKQLEVEAEENPETTVEEKDAKPADPALYCHICKSQMACTEQMTSHLNGKKHLQKEKNHILRMMKGDSEEAKPKTRHRDNEDEEYDEDGNEEHDDGNEENVGDEDGDAEFVGAENDQ